MKPNSKVQGDEYEPDTSSPEFIEPSRGVIHLLNPPEHGEVNPCLNYIAREINANKRYVLAGGAMAQNIKPQKSITEEILDEFFALLKEYTEFDAETIGDLRQLAQNGELKKAAQVAKVIKVSSEIGHET